jgi:hypothetical protein
MNEAIRILSHRLGELLDIQMQIECGIIENNTIEQKISEVNEAIERLNIKQSHELVENSTMPIDIEVNCDNCKYHNPKNAHMKCQTCDSGYSNFKQLNANTETKHLDPDFNEALNQLLENKT